MNRRRFFSAAGAATATATLARSSAAAAASGAAPDGPTSRGGNSAVQRALDERKASLKGMPEPIALPRRVTAGLEPWTPSPGSPWDRRRAVYLLRRTMFGAKKSDIDLALSKSPSEVVDMLLESKPLPAAPGTWVNDNYVYDLKENNDADNATWLTAFKTWWMSLVLNQELSIREKMVYFWHDHWATEMQDVQQPHFNYWFTTMFRENFLGNFKQMVKNVTSSPAMLIYLDGRYNVKGRPNENYARELMELHTLGEGIGYTEDDIKAAARALTGWTLKSMGTTQTPTGKNRTMYHPKDGVHVPGNFDATSKTFMGQTGNWNADDVVNIIFTERRTEVSKFICRKLYRQFVYEIADETVVTAMADMLVSSNWEIRPVLTALLKSAHFFEAANIGAHITSPLEQYAGAIRTLEIPTTGVADVYTTCANLGLQLGQPPNVKGWPEYRTWISASRLASRWNATDLLVDDSKKPGSKFPFDPVAFVSKISTPSDARKINQDIIDLFFDIPLNAYQTEVLFEKFMSGWRDYEWDINNPGAIDRIRTLLKAALRNNEAQLT